MGRLVRLDTVVNTILSRHKYPRQISGVVAESTALGALLSSTINTMVYLHCKLKAAVRQPWLSSM